MRHSTLKRTNLVTFETWDVADWLALAVILEAQMLSIESS
jgi:hypothetical protein